MRPLPLPKPFRLPELPAGFIWAGGEYSRHAAGILAIFNEAIAHSAALYEYEPRSLETMQRWFAAKAAGHYPVWVIETQTGAVAGFASYGAFRLFPAYKYTLEHSLYVHQDWRGMGLGRRLLQVIEAGAAAQDCHVLIAAIDAGNHASRGLHERAGFACQGTLNAVGFKFGQWLDLCLYQKLLTTPAQPHDG